MRQRLLSRLGALPLALLLLALAPPAAAPANGAARCDPLDPAHCLLPWPNDLHTRADRSTPTAGGSR